MQDTAAAPPCAAAHSDLHFTGQTLHLQPARLKQIAQNPMAWVPRAWSRRQHGCTRGTARDQPPCHCPYLRRAGWRGFLVSTAAALRASSACSDEETSWTRSGPPARRGANQLRRRASALRQRSSTHRPSAADARVLDEPLQICVSHIFAGDPMATGGDGMDGGGEIATGLGLLAAIPAVIYYNKLSSDSDRIVSGYEAFADEFATILSRQLDS